MSTICAWTCQTDECSFSKCFHSLKAGKWPVAAEAETQIDYLKQDSVPTAYDRSTLSTWALGSSWAAGHVWRATTCHPPASRRVFFQSKTTPVVPSMCRCHAWVSGPLSHV